MKFVHTISDTNEKHLAKAGHQPWVGSPEGDEIPTKLRRDSDSSGFFEIGIREGKSRIVSGASWPSLVETHFSESPDWAKLPKLEKCRLGISKTILFSEFIVAPGA